MSALPSPIAATLMLRVIIPKDLTNVLVKLDMLEMEKIALVTMKHHNSLNDLTGRDKKTRLIYAMHNGICS